MYGAEGRGAEGGGKVALITGASSGIGRASAEQLKRKGYVVYASARRDASLRELGQEGFNTVHLDVSEPASLLEAFAVIEAAHGGVDILVNNAGYGLNGPVEELDLAKVRHEFETNVFGLVGLTQLALPGMRRKRWGRVINIGSVGGSFTAPGAGAYHASKYAVEAFSDALRMETRAFGVEVVLIKPTGVHTEFDKKILTTFLHSPEGPYGYFKQKHAEVTQRMFSGRSYGVIKPEAVAKVVLRAVEARRPRSRYVVGTSGHLYLGLRRLLSDRSWDRMMAAQFPVRP